MHVFLVKVESARLFVVCKRTFRRSNSGRPKFVHCVYRNILEYRRRPKGIDQRYSFFLINRVHNDVTRRDSRGEFWS